MPRPEKPIDRQAGAVSAFAYDLRTLKQHAGLTYESMAKIAAYSRSALAKVVNGELPTSWPVVRAYVRACGADEAPWYARWQALQRQYSRQRVRRSADRVPDSAPLLPVPPPPPEPASLDSVAAFVAALDDLRARAGLSYRRLSELTSVCGERVAPTTLFELLHGDRLPPESMLLTYLRACGVVQAAAVGAWRVTYRRLSTPPVMRQPAPSPPERGPGYADQPRLDKRMLARPRWTGRPPPAPVAPPVSPAFPAPVGPPEVAGRDRPSADPVAVLVIVIAVVLSALALLCALAR